VLMAIKNKQLLPISDLDRGFIHPRAPAQVLVSYYQAGKICDFITEKWGWDTILAMLKDYANDVDTPTVIRKELKMEPEEFDKQFLAMIEAETKKSIDSFPEWTDDVKTISAAVQSERLRHGDQARHAKRATSFRTMWKPAAFTNFSPKRISQRTISQRRSTSCNDT
jgi:hypothetical protein